MLCPFELRAHKISKLFRTLALLYRDVLLFTRIHVTFIYQRRQCVCQTAHSADDLLRERFDVASASNAHRAVAENRLDRNVRNSQIVQIRGESAPKAVPSAPF